MKISKSKKTPAKEIEADEWDISEGMGILPNDVPLTQNIGCVGGKTQKPTNIPKNSTK